MGKGGAQAIGCQILQCSESKSGGFKSIYGVGRVKLVRGTEKTFIMLKRCHLILGVSEAVAELEDVKVTEIENGNIDIDELDELHFASTFKALLDVIQEQDSKQRISKERREKHARSRSLSKKGTSNAVSTKATKHIKMNTQDYCQPKTPDQPIPPPNPNLSGLSTESKDDENTKVLLNTLLSDTMTIIKSEVRTLHWVRSDCKVEITKTFFS